MAQGFSKLRACLKSRYAIASADRCYRTYEKSLVVGRFQSGVIIREENGERPGFRAFEEMFQAKKIKQVGRTDKWRTDKWRTDKWRTDKLSPQGHILIFPYAIFLSVLSSTS